MIFGKREPSPRPDEGPRVVRLDRVTVTHDIAAWTFTACNQPASYSTPFSIAPRRDPSNLFASIYYRESLGVEGETPLAAIDSMIAALQKFRTVVVERMPGASND